MLAEIKDVKQCKNKALGNCILRRRDRVLITISLKGNERLAEYLSTLGHEMAHLFFTLARKKGLRITDRLEHKVIYALEVAFIRVFGRYFKDGRPRPWKKST